MSKNPFLRRVLGEADDDLAAVPREVPVEDQDQIHDEPAPEPAEPAPMPTESSPSVQNLAQMWQSGQKMDVATELMFTPASYADFVDLCFVIGQSEGRQLGGLLDELADSENIPVPTPSDGYASVLQRVSDRTAPHSAI